MKLKITTLVIVEDNQDKAYQEIQEPSIHTSPG